MALGKETVLQPETKAETFSGRIRQLRGAIGMTQRELAQKVSANLRNCEQRGFDLTYLSKIEKERFAPPSTPAILHVLKCSSTRSWLN